MQCVTHLPFSHREPVPPFIPHPLPSFLGPDTGNLQVATDDEQLHHKIASFVLLLLLTFEFFLLFYLFVFVIKSDSFSKHYVTGWMEGTV